MQSPQPWWRCGVVGLVVVGLMVAGTSPVAWAANKAEAAVIPCDANAYGNTYGEWSAQWVQWLLAIPAATHPALETTGAHCAEGQAGPVWFLAGTFGGEPVTRQCTVPAGKALFFPLANGLFGAGALDCEPTGSEPCNLVTLREAAAASMDAVELHASLDGEPLPRLRHQRVQSPVLTLTYPEDNLATVLTGVEIPGGTYTPYVVDGYWLLLAPLSAGAHTLSFRAEITGGVFAGFVADVTYHLTVGP
jgi:hypothetical protein